MGIRRGYLDMRLVEDWPLDRAQGGPLTEPMLRFWGIPPESVFVAVVDDTAKMGWQITLAHPDFPDCGPEPPIERWDTGGEGIHLEEWRDA